MIRRTFWALVAAAGVAACGGAEPRPGLASETQHDQQARQADSDAEAHAGQVDPSQERTRYSCPKTRGAEGACWTWETNPTEKHLGHAEQLRTAAEAHRKAAAALRDAEARSCAGVSEVDRDMSPFDHQEDVLGVSPAATGRGTAITLRAVPGLDAAYLQKIVDCHLARNTSMGFAMPEMQTCPLAVKGSTASVAPDPRGLAVTVRATDDASLAEIDRRARALTPAPAGR
jgi:hypothetical protein